MKWGAKAAQLGNENGTDRNVSLRHEADPTHPVVRSRHVLVRRKGYYQRADSLDRCFLSARSEGCWC